MFDINIRKNYNNKCGCCCCCCNHNSRTRVIPDELIVWKKPDVPRETFDNYKRDIFTRFPDVYVRYTCGDCDNELELWEGAGLETFCVSKGLSSGGSGTSGMHGDDAIAYFISNIEFEIPFPFVGRSRKDEQRPNDPKNPNRIPTPNLTLPDINNSIPIGGQEDCKDKPITVAVFDTGLLPIISSRYPGTLPIKKCSPGDNSANGWNFVSRNNFTIDDNWLYKTYHGTTVSKFIIDQVVKGKKHKINLIPIKVQNAEGKGSLIDVLCGFGYASNNGADIINASLGFYWLESSLPDILVQFVKKYLTERGVILVCAAGNANNESDADFRNMYPAPAMNPRNLEQHPFFPASLSLFLDNVIAVTTVSAVEKKPSPTQNFSNRIVDFGVHGNNFENIRIHQTDYGFVDPLNRGVPLLGSSFAAPIITGRICSNYSEVVVKVANRINKVDLINRIRSSSNMAVQADAALGDFVRDGLYTTI